MFYVDLFLEYDVFIVDDNFILDFWICLSDVEEMECVEVRCGLFCGILNEYLYI